MMRPRLCTLALVVGLALSAAACSGSANSDPSATGPVLATTADIGHVHDIVILDDEVHLAAHTGLFRVEGPDEAVLVGDFRHDYMSMASTTSGLIASGHPDLRYDEWRVEGLPAHLGLIRSDDLGRTWDKTSLLGEVDFHALTERSDGGLYGADSAGVLLASDDGLEWETRSSIAAVDLAASPADPDSLVAIDAASGRLLVSADGARTWQQKAAPNLFRVTWDENGLNGMTADGDLLTATGVDGPWEAVGQVDDPVALVVRENEWWIATASASVLYSNDGAASFAVLFQAPPR